MISTRFTSNVACRSNPSMGNGKRCCAWFASVIVVLCIAQAQADHATITFDGVAGFPATVSDGMGGTFTLTATTGTPTIDVGPSGNELAGLTNNGLNRITITHSGPNPFSLVSVQYRDDNAGAGNAQFNVAAIDTGDDEWFVTNSTNFLTFDPVGTSLEGDLSFSWRMNVTLVEPPAASNQDARMDNIVFDITNPPAVVPTLNEWGTIALVLALGCAAYLRLGQARRQQAA